MRMVGESDAGLDRHYNLSVETEYPVLDNCNQGRSCFYDYGARCSVEFSGFVDQGDSAFISEVEKCFN